MLMTFFFRGYAAINNILVVFGRVDLKRCYIMGRQENFAFISLQVGSLFFYVFPPIWWIFYLLFSVDWYNSIFYLTDHMSHYLANNKKRWKILFIGDFTEKNPPELPKPDDL